MSRRERQLAAGRLLDQGRALHIAGRNDEAEKIFREVVAADANNAEALHRLGMLLGNRGQFSEALALMQRSMGLAPLVPEFHNNLGELYRKAGMAGDARLAYLRAIQLRPNFCAAINNLALALIDLAASGSAVETARTAVALAPNDSQMHFTLGLALSAAHQPVEAVSALCQAVALRPDFDEARTRLVYARAAAGESFESIAAEAPSSMTRTQLVSTACAGYFSSGHTHLAEPILDDALKIEPTDPNLLVHKGNILKERGETDKAGEYFSAAHAAGGGGGALFNLSICRLKRGELKSGFAGYELRKHPAPPSDGGAPRPQWDGSDPAGKTILLTREQGFGDAIMFIRYASLLARRGAKVWVQAPLEIHDLLKRIEGVSRVASPDEEIRGFHFYIPMASLALAFGTELETIPTNTPYIHADPDRAAIWKSRLASITHGFRVGLVWQGNPTHQNDHRRSLPLSALVPLDKIPGVTLFSLQKGKGAEQLNTPNTPQVIDLACDLKDFSDTAAAIEALDLLIAVDTAVIHLAGAMNRPVWSLHALDADFRWMERRSDSPWYPSMRLYRQKSLGHWADVVEEVVHDLFSLAVKKRPPA